MSNISKEDIKEIIDESFWETAKGQQLADIMIQSLPKLNYKVRQCYFEVKSEDVVDVVKSKIDNGLCLEHMMETDNGRKTLLIFSKLTPIRNANN
mgnify:CR=1 FL=1